MAEGHNHALFVPRGLHLVQWTTRVGLWPTGGSHKDKLPAPSLPLRSSPVGVPDPEQGLAEKGEDSYYPAVSRWSRWAVIWPVPAGYRPQVASLNGGTGTRPCRPASADRRGHHLVTDGTDGGGRLGEGPVRADDVLSYDAFVTRSTPLPPIILGEPPGKRVVEGLGRSSPAMRG